MRLIHFIFGILLFAFLQQLPGQNACRGIITDQEGAPVSFARITQYLAQPGTRTDDAGKFIIPLIPARDSLFIRALGYEGVDTLVRRKNDECNLKITLRTSSLAAIEVRATRSIGINKLVPSIAKIKSVPVLLGQTDVLKSLTIYPGVSSISEGAAQLSVRGGEDNQNLYLLDGATIYNPGHFFGFLSAYNPNTINSVVLYKDYIPGRYASRLSSVLDVRTKPGGPVRRRTKEISLMTMGYTDEGTLNENGSLTYGGGVRLAHTAFITLVTLPSYLAGQTPVAFGGMYDVNLKVRKNYSDDRFLEASVYVGDDLYGGSIKAQETEDTGRGSALFSYGNRALSLRYLTSRNSVASEWLFTHSTYRNNYRISERFGSIEEAPAFLFRSTARLNNSELTYRMRLPGTAGLSIGFLAGANRIIPSLVDLTSEGISVTNSGQRFDMLSAAGFLDSSVKLTESVQLQTGLRLGSAFGADLFNRKLYPALSPSLSLSYRGGNTTTGLSFRSIAQFVHSVDLASGGFPVRLWLPANDRLPPERDFTYSVYHYFRSKNEKLKFSASAYYRQLKNQLVAPLGDFSSGLVDEIDSGIIGGGDGVAYGLELYAESSVGTKTLVSCAYTLSRSIRVFDDFNQGERFPANFDRPHDLYLTLERELSPKWTFSSIFAMSSGLPLTQPTAVILNSQGLPRDAVTEYNNVRFAPYHRLDILFRKTRVTKKGRSGILSIGLYNVYGRRNPINVRYGIRSTIGTNPSTGLPANFSNVTARGTSLFSHIPILSYEVKY